MADEKPSRYQQWQERPARPVAAQPMTPGEIEDFRRNLVASYRCPDKEIDFEFQRIIDEDDVDRDDFFWLRYFQHVIVKGAKQRREIFIIKVPIPDRIKKQAEANARQPAPPRRRPRTAFALPGPEISAPAPPVATFGEQLTLPAAAPVAPTARPRLRAPRAVTPCADVSTQAPAQPVAPVSATAAVAQPIAPVVVVAAQPVTQPATPTAVVAAQPVAPVPVVAVAVQPVTPTATVAAQPAPVAPAPTPAVTPPGRATAASVRAKAAARAPRRTGIIINGRKS